MAPEDSYLPPEQQVIMKPSCVSLILITELALIRPPDQYPTHNMQGNYRTNSSGIFLFLDTRYISCECSVIFSFLPIIPLFSVLWDFSPE